MGKSDRTMTHPFHRKPQPSDTSWVPGATAPTNNNEFFSTENARLSPTGPPEPDNNFNLNYDSSEPTLWLPEVSPIGDIESFSDIVSDSYRAEIRCVVEKYRDTFQGPQEKKRTIEEIFAVTQDDAKMNDMCAYDALCACYPDSLPVDIENELTRQVWAQIGKDASHKYKQFLEEIRDMPENVRELLSQLEVAEHEKYVSLAKQHMEENKSSPDIIASVPSNTFFNHNPASPKRRPSARTPIRDPGWAQWSSTADRPDQERSPKRARRASQDNNSPQQFPSSSRTALSSKGKEPLNSSSNQSSPRRAQTPPRLNFSSSQPGSHGRRPRSAEAKPKGRQDAVAMRSTAAAKQDIAVGGLRRPPDPHATNKLIPHRPLDNYEKIKYDVAFRFLGGEHQLGHYGRLEGKLDHMISVFKRHCGKGAVAPFHVTQDPCESDDEMPPKGCFPKRKPIKCFILFHNDLDNFYGKSIQEYADAFKTPEFFFKCVLRALTKILIQYCRENNIPEPAFYPSYIEEALVQFAIQYPVAMEGEGPHLATTLGIDVQEVEKRLIMLRAKQINQYDQQRELTDAQIIGSKHEQEFHPPQPFPGNNAFHKLSPRVTKAITSWLINNKEKVTPNNRLPDQKTFQMWLKILEEEHPQFKSHFTKELIDKYCIRYQNKHFQKFPLLPRPESNLPVVEELAPEPFLPAPKLKPAAAPIEIVVLSSDSE